MSSITTVPAGARSNTKRTERSVSGSKAGLASAKSEREVEVPLDGEAPEPLPEAGVDAGALAAEHLALLLDPYPRHPDAPSGPLEYATGEAAGKAPFAALGQLKSKL